MASDEPIEVVGTNTWAMLLNVVAWAVAIMFGAIVAVPGSDALGIESDVTMAGLFLGLVVAVMALFVVGVAGREVRFHDDRVELTGGRIGIGEWSTDYGDVELVVRKTAFADRVLGTGTFELVRRGGSNNTLRRVADPDDAARTLAERVAPPSQQFERASGRHKGELWYLWPEDVEPPADPVVEEEELGDLLGVDTGDLKLDALDEAEAHEDFSDLGDIGDVAGDIGADGGDGGDGGGGGE